MKEITVTYTLSDKDEYRLKKITEEYRKQGIDLTEDKLFKTMMTIGSFHTIDQKLSYHEWSLGLKEILDYVKG